MKAVDKKQRRGRADEQVEEGDEPVFVSSAPAQAPEDRHLWAPEVITPDAQRSVRVKKHVKAVWDRRLEQAPP